jgi:hypothetical protein
LACQGFLFVLTVLFAAILLARYGAWIVTWVSQFLTSGFVRDDRSARHDSALRPDCLQVNLNNVVNAKVPRIDVNIPRLTVAPAAKDWLNPSKEWLSTDLSNSFDSIVGEHMTAPERKGSEGFDFRVLAGEKSGSKDLVVHGPSKIMEVLLDLKDFAASRLNILRIQNYTDSFNSNYRVALQNADQCKQKNIEKERELLALLNSHSTRQSEKVSKDAQLNKVKTDISNLELEIEREKSKQKPRNPETADIDREIEALQLKLSEADNDQ